MRVTLIAAMGSNRVIGKGNQLIWHMPKDLKFFKEKTTAHAVIMGRKTFESVGKRPLPNRTNIVITSSEGYEVPEGVIVVKTIEDALKAVPVGETEAFIVGGAQIYEAYLAAGLATHIYLTEIHQEFDGDTYFPGFALNVWKEVWREDNEADEKNKYPFSFVLFEKHMGKLDMPGEDTH
jgi:dihydrofolate reductase